jgi:hypothetical protein
MTADRPEQWFSVAEAAHLCRRSPKTIENLVSRYQLPRRLGWEVKRRKRRRVVLLSPATVVELQSLTLWKVPRRHLSGQNMLVPPPPSSIPPSGGATS